MLRGRIYIPKDLRKDVVETLHAAHQATENMKSSARNEFFWPGMDRMIAQARDQCKFCNETSTSQPGEPMTELLPPTFLFEQVCLNYMDLKGKKYLVEADRYSGWLSVTKMASTSFTNLAVVLRQLMCWHGVPEVMETEGGPPFTGKEFAEFCSQWKITHRLSSAGFPQSNGRAELPVKSAKCMISNNVDASGELSTDGMVRAILQCKNTPLRGIAESPAQILFGSPLNDKGSL